MLSTQEIRAEGRTVPLWLTILMAAGIFAVVAYNSLTVKSSTDVLDELNKVDEESKQDRVQLNAEVSEITAKVGRIEKRVNEAHENFLPAEKIVELVNEQAAFPWHEEKEQWLRWRAEIDERTIEILGKVTACYNGGKGEPPSEDCNGEGATDAAAAAETED